MDDLLHFLENMGVRAWLLGVHGTAIPREMVPVVHYVLLYGVQTLYGSESIHARPSLLCSDEALMPLVGFNARQGRQGVCQPGASKRQGKPLAGPICPETLAKHSLTLNVGELEALCNGAIRALAKAGVCGAKVTGMADGTDVETTARDVGCGQVTHQGRLDDTQGRVHAIEATVYGWTVLWLIDAATKIPRAVRMGPIDEPEIHWPRALVIQARAKLAGAARLYKYANKTPGEMSLSAGNVSAVSCSSRPATRSS